MQPEVPVRSIPVIAIDGPSASGKGTVAQRLAAQLGWHYLDSGAIYRLLAHAAASRGVPIDHEAELGSLASALMIEFQGAKIFLDNQEVSNDIRSEECGRLASVIAALPMVRAALLDRQRAFRRTPGLVADGRDMGSIVFPDAQLKIFLTASAEIRAERRLKQLKDKGITASINPLLRDLIERDARDQARSVAPLQQGPDAKLLDTSSLTVDQAVERILAWQSATG